MDSICVMMVSLRFRLVLELLGLRCRNFCVGLVFLLLDRFLRLVFLSFLCGFDMLLNYLVIMVWLRKNIFILLS